MSLALLSFVIAMVIAVPAGLISALKKHSAMDHAVTAVAFLGLSMPDFWLAILLIIVFAANLHWLPGDRLRAAGRGLLALVLASDLAVDCHRQRPSRRSWRG